MRYDGEQMKHVVHYVRVIIDEWESPHYLVVKYGTNDRLMHDNAIRARPLYCEHPPLPPPSTKEHKTQR